MRNVSGVLTLIADSDFKFIKNVIICEWILLRPCQIPYEWCSILLGQLIRDLVIFCDRFACKQTKSLDFFNSLSHFVLQKIFMSLQQKGCQ
jgi:hypothetical protein